MTYFHQKKIIALKFGNLDTFPSECFSFQCIFATHGLEGLVSSSGSYYIDLVRDLFRNTSLKNNKLTSSVKGVPISLTVKKLGECMKIPFFDSEFMANYDSQQENYNKRNFYYNIIQFYKDEIYNKRKRSSGVVPDCPLSSASNFSSDDKMLNYFICYLLVLIFSNHAIITDAEMQQLFSLKNGILINWVYVIMHHMLSHNERLGGLPYARILKKPSSNAMSTPRMNFMLV